MSQISSLNSPIVLQGPGYPPAFIGIDPGVTGALAVLDRDGEVILLEPAPCLSLTKQKKVKGKTQSVQVRELNPNAMAEMLQSLTWTYKPIAAIELVHAMPDQGVTSMFNFGMGYGLWLGILAALEIRYEKISPQTWQKEMLRDMAKSGKDASLAKASQLWPKCSLSRKKDNGLSDALLIAEYLRKNHAGNGINTN